MAVTDRTGGVTSLACCKSPPAARGGRPALAAAAAPAVVGNVNMNNVNVKVKVKISARATYRELLWPSLSGTSSRWRLAGKGSGEG